MANSKPPFAFSSKNKKIRSPTGTAKFLCKHILFFASAKQTHHSGKHQVKKQR
jgi:hypothetical protein